MNEGLRDSGGDGGTCVIVPRLRLGMLDDAIPSEARDWEAT